MNVERKAHLAAQFYVQMQCLWGSRYQLHLDPVTFATLDPNFSHYETIPSDPFEHAWPIVPKYTMSVHPLDKGNVMMERIVWSFLKKK
jgi:hypothetical protein